MTAAHLTRRKFHGLHFGFQKMEGMKNCKTCGKLMERKRKKGVLETMRDFQKREYCNRRCAARYQHAAKKGEFPVMQARKAVRESAQILDDATVSETKKMSALEFLEQTINDKTVDRITRVTAAKALLPYQEKKPGEQGKKAEQDEAAKEATRGRFGAMTGPKVVNIKN